MRALVTGASGFVGGHLVAHLEACGDEVIGTDRSDGGPDLLDAEGFEHLLTDIRPEVVYHLAGQADVGRSWSAPVETLRANVEGTHNVLAAARSAEVARVVTVTSADIYGRVEPGDLPLTESAPIRPVSPYAASKTAADLVAQQAHLGHGQDVVRARSFNHLGPGQSDRFVCSALAARIVANERSGGSEVRVGNLTPRRDFTDVRDVVRAYRRMATSGVAGRAYNVCSGRSTSVQEVVDRLLEMSPQEMQVEVDPDLFRPADLEELWGDPSRLVADTGWSTEYALDDTLKDLLEDWRERLSTAD
tara:strand:+ start:110 stop:1021 length:912 start_codon:yes stop_codon:yes gene_type:complete